jgi:predicted metal-binding membrane protein
MVVPNPGSTGNLVAGTAGMSIGMWLAMWALMCAATMIPTVIPAIRHVAANSLRRRAGRSIAVLVGTYLTGWFAFGLIALAFVTLLRWLVVPGWVMVLGVAVIGMCWLVLPVQKPVRWACHKSVPLPPTGWRAIRACAHFGARQLLACLGICWPMMMLMALEMNGSVLWMITLAAVVTAWKYLPRKYQPRLRRSAFVSLFPRRRGGGVVALGSSPLTSR